MDHDELRVVCDSYEGLWRALLSAQTTTYTTYVVHETESTTVPWAILGVTNDGYTLRVTPLDMGRIPVGVSFCFQENTSELCGDLGPRGGSAGAGDGCLDQFQDLLLAGGKLDGQVRNLDHGSILGMGWIEGCLDIQ